MNALLAMVIVVSMLTSPGSVAGEASTCATPVPIASPTPAIDSCDWDALIAAIDRQIGGSEHDRFTLGQAEPPLESKYLPAGSEHAATWRAELTNGGGAHWVSLLRYDSGESLAASRADYEAALEAEFFVPATVRSLDEPDACFYLLREESARGICLLERGELLIVGYSFFEIDFADGQLAVALELTRLVDATLVEVDAGPALG